MTGRPGPADPLPDAGWFAELAERSGVIFFVLRVQPDIAYEYVSGSTFDNLGVTAEQVLADADNLHSLLDPQYGEALAGALAAQPGRQVSLELKWRHAASGLPLHSRVWMRARRRPDGSVVLEGTVREITELRFVETELRHSEERYRLLAENAWEVIWTMALDGSVTYVSPAVERVRGITPEQAKRQSLAEIHPPASAASVAAYYQRLFAAIDSGAPPPVFRGEHEYYRADGSIMTGELQVIPHVDADGNVVEILGVTRDVSDRKAMEAELTRLAVTDPLTGLWNRRRTTELLFADLAQARRHGQALTVLMVDVDHFKSINDSHGHQIGDRVLIDVAHRLREQFRTTDVVGRWGGEEFVVLLRHCGLPDALAAAEKLRREIAEARFADLFSVSVSIGAAEWQPDEDVHAWLARADAALYRAKDAGRNATATG